MDYNDGKLKTTACALLLCAAMLGSCATALGANNAAALFQGANKSYVELCRDESAKKMRDNWLKVIDKFLNIPRNHPGSKFAPEAFYKGAKIYEHLSKYSGRSSDLGKASRTYQDMAAKYPGAGIADDALYNAALLEERLKQKEKALSLYQRVVEDYPESDMAGYAREKIGKTSSGGAGAPDAAKDRRLAAIKSEERALADAQGKTAGKRIESGDGRLSVVRKVRHWAEGDQIRVVVDLDDAVPYKTFLLPEDTKAGRPDRLVIDIPGTRAARDVPGRQNVDDGVVSCVRVSQFSNTQVRVVLDLKGKPKYNLFKMDDPCRIVIDLDNGRTGTEVAAGSAPGTRNPAQQPDPVMAKSDPPTIATQLCLKISRIVIDPGHGGKDPGAISAAGIREKDITLEIGKLLARRLRSDGFEVYLTRTKDEFLTLEERTVFANKKKADLFISVHVNSHHNNALSGIETYFLNLTTDSSAIEVAARENAMVQKSLSDLQLIINDLMLNSKINESSKFANCVHTCIYSSALKIGYGGRNLGVKQAPFYVLLGAQMPSILLELGFLTNNTDRDLLQRRSYQDTLVEGIAKGINNYIMNTTYAYGWRNR